jgi:hypothetical protein
MPAVCCSSALRKFNIAKDFATGSKMVNNVPRGTF